MYPKYFGLSEASFSITPDPHYLFLSDQHREALAHLLYGAGDSGGFVLLTGEVGTGKTTVCRAFLEQLPADVDVALVVNPAMTAGELLHAICDEFRVDVADTDQTVKALVDRLNRFLLDAHARGRRPVLIIDEAQNLRPKVMEQIRLLTNLETSKRKLLQIFLIGQPELRQLLASADLRQLNQRITARFHLRPLNAAETAAYVDHRIAVAGVDRPLFSRKALRLVHRYSGGVPRLVNLLCDRALLGAAVSRQMQVTPAIVTRAAREVRGSGGEGAMLAVRGAGHALAVAALVLVGVLGGMWIGASGVLERLPAPLAALLPDRQQAAAGATDDEPAPVAEAPEGEGGAEPRVADEDVSAQDPEIAAPIDDRSSDDATAAVEVPVYEPGPAALDTAGEVPETVAAVAAPAAEPGSEPAAGADVDAGVDNPAAELSGEHAAVDTGDASATDVAGAAASADQPLGAESPAATPVGTVAVEPATATPAEAEITAAPPAAPAVPEQVVPRIAMVRVAPELPEIDAKGLAQVALPREAIVDELLRVWGVSADAAVSRLDCGAVAAFGLDCERGNGRWSDLRLFDRPAALQLTLPDGSQPFAVIGALDAEYAVVHRDGRVHRVPIALLDEHWSGDYLILWRLPPVGARVIGKGSNRDAVGWLRARLAELPDVELAPEPPRYDSALVDTLRAFQSARGLMPDGVAGPRTLILLANALSAADTPRLSQSP